MMQNMRMFWVKTWGCFMVKHADVLMQNMGMFSDNIQGV